MIIYYGHPTLRTECCTISKKKCGLTYGMRYLCTPLIITRPQPLASHLGGAEGRVIKPGALVLLLSKSNEIAHIYAYCKAC